MRVPRRNACGIPGSDDAWHRAELLDDDELYLMDYHEFREWTTDTLRPSDAVAGFREHRTLDAALEAIIRGDDGPVDLRRAERLSARCCIRWQSACGGKCTAAHPSPRVDPSRHLGRHR
jgi:hypothetical protein